MDSVQVRFLDDVVIKNYRNHSRGNLFFQREFTAHRRLWWATPKVFAMYGMEIMTERLPCILEFPPEETAKYREHLYWLVQKVHEAGYWHGNIDLKNVVLDPVRGPLLTNWENMSVSSGEESYDIHGPIVLLGDPPEEGEYAFWFGDSPTHPYNFWKGH